MTRRREPMDDARAYYAAKGHTPVGSGYRMGWLDRIPDVTVTDDMRERFRRLIERQAPDLAEMLGLEVGA